MCWCHVLWFQTDIPSASASFVPVSSVNNTQSFLPAYEIRLSRIDGEVVVAWAQLV